MLEDVLVQEWMTSPVITVPPGTLISHAHQMMKDHGIRRLVVAKDKQITGMITIGDIREASPSDATSLSIWELNYLWAQLTVDKVMSRKVITVNAEQPLIDAAQLMLDNKVSGLPVLDARGQLVGIITESDIFRMLVQSRAGVGA